MDAIVWCGGVVGAVVYRRSERSPNALPDGLLESIAQRNFLKLSAGIAITNRQVFDRWGNVQLGAGGQRVPQWRQFQRFDTSGEEQQAGDPRPRDKPDMPGMMESFC